MPLVWIRDEAEEAVYQQSLVDPDKRFIVQETSCQTIYYRAGVKCITMNRVNTIKEKGKPYRHPSFEVIYWDNKPQISFSFMHPYHIHHLEVKPFVPDLPFTEKQMKLDLYGVINEAI